MQVTRFPALAPNRLRYYNVTASRFRFLTPLLDNMNVNYYEHRGDCNKQTAVKIFLPRFVRRI